jgi:hypothetical protein
MTGVVITSLPTASTLTGAEYVPVVQSGTTVKTTVQSFLTTTKKNTTANRPTLTANDIGILYLDTTLDADGKPIWWTGVAWVDATGTVV